MTITNYHPRCSIPHIDLNESPEREEENERNKIAYGWQEGDGYISEQSQVPIVDSFDGTIEHFDKLLKERPNSKLEDKSPDELKLNILCRAATGSSVEVLKHIVKIGGKHLLEIGSGVKNDTPLLCTMKYGNDLPVLKDSVTIMADTLLRLGANPSMANSDGETPFWYGLEYISNPQLMKLFISYQAAINPELSNNGKANLKKHINELFDQKEITELYKAKLDENSTIRNLNYDEFNVLIEKIISTFKIRVLEDLNSAADLANDLELCTLF